MPEFRADKPNLADLSIYAAICFWPIGVVMFAIVCACEAFARTVRE